MNLQPTTTTIMASNAQPFVVATPPVPRPVNRAQLVLHPDHDLISNVDANPAVDSAERNRQDALEFLHRLIMG